MATKEKYRALATPRSKAVRIVKKAARPMSPDEPLLGAGHLRRSNPHPDASKSLLGDEIIGISEDESSTATLLKYTPQGATMAKAMDKFEDVFQTPGPVSDKGTQDSPIEIFDLEKPPPVRRLFRRGNNWQQLILVSPARLVRHVKRKAKQVAAKGGKRKRESVNAANGGEGMASKEHGKEKEEKMAKRTKRTKRSAM